MTIISKLIPVVSLGLGTFAGITIAMLTQTEQTADADQLEEQAAKSAEQPESNQVEYVKLNNQFVIPVVQEDLISALVVVSLGLETVPGQSEFVYSWEPKLRDVFLQVLFDFSNIGGFEGMFTAPNNLNMLRSALRAAARKEFGDGLLDVLIIDIARQDV